MTPIEIILYGIIVTVGGGLILYALYRYLDDRRDFKKKHKEKLREKILHRLGDANIYYKDFKILITDVDDLKKQEEFDLAFQHLKHKDYSDILTSWDNSIELIDGNVENEGLNKKLEDLKKYILEKIGKRFNNQYMEYLLSNIWLIVEKYITDKIKDLNNLKIDIQKNSKYCYVDDIGIHCKKYSNKKVKRAIMDLIKDNEFKEKLSKIQAKSRELRKIYDNNFKSYLKELLERLENGYNLKGKCEECSFWGDC